MVFYAFDLLLLPGEDIRGLRPETRPKMLRTQLLPKFVEPVRASESFNASADQLIRAVRDCGLEGVIAKRRDSFYEPGRRSGAWRKMRVNRRQEFVIGGYGSPRECISGNDLATETR